MNRIFWAFMSLIIIYAPGFSQSYSKKNMDTVNEKESSFKHEHTSVDNKFYSLAADVSALGEDASVLFFNDKCIVIGKQGVPYILNASGDFNPSILPITLQSNIHRVESVILSLEMSDDTSRKDVPIPTWLKSFRDMKYLTVEDIRLTLGFFTECDQLKHLIIIGGLKQDAIMLAENTSQLKSLEYLVHNNFLTEQEVLAIKTKSPRLAVLSETEYDKKLETGEIKIPE